jgi:hypothetical protein
LPAPPLDDPKAITNFFGGGNCTINSDNVDLTIGVLSNDGSKASEDSVNFIVNNPLTRKPSNRSEVDGYGTAIVNIDGDTFTFTIRITGTVYTARHASHINGEFYAVDANLNRIEQGPQAIFDGTFQQ